jgi:predicted AAA+ superfamily ATPase
VLEHLQAHYPDTPVRYWRDKGGREVDFILPRSRDEVDAIECKWDVGSFDAASLKAFRELYPKGKNYLIVPSEPVYQKRFGKLEVKICPPSELQGPIPA